MFDSKKGGKKKLEALDIAVAEQPNLLKKEANLHLGTMLRRGPGIPFHHVVFDPMHGCHNEVNVLLDESVHKHLMVDSPDAEVKRAIEEAQAEINRMWKDANLPKFIQFGKDGQGAHSHALDGPSFKAAFRHPTLITQTIQVMQAKVYQLLETKKLIPVLEEKTVQDAAEDKKGAPRGRKRGDPASPDKPKKAAKPAKKGKSREIRFDEDEAGAPAPPPPPPAPRGQKDDQVPNSKFSFWVQSKSALRSLTIVCSPFGSLTIVALCFVCGFVAGRYDEQ